MSQHHISILADGSMSPKAWYQNIQALPNFVADVAQAATVEELDALWHQLLEFKSKRNNFLGRSLLKPAVPKGLYLWGGVGRGKTFLMDAFYASLPYRRKRRIHFHNFMAEVHHEMKLLERENDPLIALADRIAQSARLLCLDEFHVNDIADAMILARLIDAILVRGVVLITTSNYPPDGLYPHGLQRQNFLPAIALLKQKLKVLQVDGGTDYRMRITTREPLFLVADDVDGMAANEARLHDLFERISTGARMDSPSIEVHERHIPVKKISHNAAWFDFNELCGGIHAQEDYLAIAHRFPTIFLSHIPRLSMEQAAEAWRFTWLIDVLYDNHVRLIASAAASPEKIDAEGTMPAEFSRTVSRLSEMQTQHYLLLQHCSRNVRLGADEKPEC